MRMLLVVTGLVLVLSGCSSILGPSSPPPLDISAGGDVLVLEPLSYCWSVGGGGACADGGTTDLETARGPGPLTLEFPVEGWEIEAAVVVDEVYEDVVLTERADQVWELAGLGPGEHHLSISGRGPQGTFGSEFLWEAS